MGETPRIAIDAMGGDHGIPVMLAGADLARSRRDDLRFLLFGDREQLADGLRAYPGLRAKSQIVHSDKIVAADAKPSQALRNAKGSSMRMAIDAVKAGEASAAVSAGNTGALMAIAKLALRTLPGIDRPALSALLPTFEDTDVVMLDLGANTECDASNLVQFAIMGAAYSRIMFGFPSPRVKLLNIGTEDGKGTSTLRAAADILKGTDTLQMDFQGFTESDKISHGDADVIVTDGFSGNIALKSIEGTARFVAGVLKRSFKSSLRSKIGFLISRPATEMLREHLDPNNHNGAVFLGLNGVVVKSHGGANEVGVANAIEVAARLVEDAILERIGEQTGMIRENHMAQAVK